MPLNVAAPVVAVGEVLWDLLPGGARLGGALTNFAILSARLGSPVALVTRVGEDELGQRAVEQLEALSAGAGARFDRSHVQHSATLATGTVSVTLDAQGRPQYTIHAPVAWDEIAHTADFQELAERAGVVCFGTLAQRLPTTRDTLRGFVEVTRPECVRVCDVNLRMPHCSAETLRWSVEHATILKVSDEELAEVGRLLELPELGAGLAGLSGEALTTAAAAAAQVLLGFAPGVAVVAMTLGPQGSLLADRDGVHRHCGLPTQVADTIGAGDAFTAGLVHAYQRGAGLAAMSSVANLCGSYVASQQGATPVLPAELLERIEKELA